MALPTDFYTPTSVSDRVTVIRVLGGYLFRLRGRISQFISDEQVLIEDNDPFGVSLYNSLAITSSVTVTKVDGGYFWETKGNDPEFSFNQLDGAALTDFHSGVKSIAADEEIIIQANKQMTVRDGVQVDGKLTIKGELILT